ncbi:hypothetical protein QR680_014289 [Steinernema hermaphroditum]|uniref:Uncharacterized protein n=1 Tax=Steinernema hermaphroditum TaxID=289476 RepID=A0AA39I8D8_9BILA|nr:hypothetical protein QR680_014289 [Steinernema hermaphroditum]
MKKKRSLLTMLTVFILLFYTDMRQVAAMGRSDTFEIDYRPVNATITIDDSNSLFVQFHNDSSTATITGLNVYLTSNRELSLPLSLWQRIEITESSYLLDPDTYDITPNTRYRLRISANDSEVELDPSHEIIIPTGNGVPLPPSDVVISLTENHTVAVSFKPVQFRRGRRKFATDYLVEYTDSPVRAPDEWVKVPVKMNKQKGNKDVVALLPGLDPNITYYLTVKSMCAKNAGAASPVEQFNIGQLNSKRPRVKIVEGTRLDLFPSTDVTLALTCTGSGKSSLPQLSWSLDGVPLVDQQGGYHIYQTAHTLDEKVTSLLKADTRTRSGNFTCVAVNEDGESSATIEVRILGPGSYPADININYGQDGFEMSWQPPIISNGMITAYIIYHTTSENSQLADWHKIQLNATETNVTIPVEHERTDYFFRVQAATGQGPGIISPPFRVKSGSKVRPLNASVVLLNVPSSGSIVDPGTVVEFKCSATGSPLPDLSYYMLSKDGQVDETSSVSIDKNTSQSAESVVIHKELTTSHQIVCVATNSLEKIENRVLVQVKKPGSPPRNVQYTIENESEIQLSWSPPELWNEPITSYKVYLTKDVSEPLSNWLSVVTDLPSILLDEDHLDPESTYYVKISAINDYGEGPSTEHPISFYSPSGGPQDPPRHVVIEFDEANAIMLRWHQPLHPKGKIRFYTIYFTKDPGLSDDLYREWETVTVPGNGNRTTFRLHQAEHNLRPKTLYRVRISASNSMGEGPSTSVTEFETAVAELPVPTDIEVSVDEDNTVHLSFIAVRNPEDHSQIVQDYKVSVSASEDTLNARWHPIEQISTMTDQLTNKVQVAIDGAMLQKNTNYWINVASDLPTQTRVQASKPKRLRTGDGEVTPTVVINEGDYISRDPDVSTSISITCDAEGVPRPRIEWIFDDTVVNTSKFYKIDDVTLDYETNPRSKRSKITMISAVKAGVLTCRAVNNKASTNASITIEIRGPGSPPANVNIYQIRNGFNLSWNEPDIPNGNITKYIIYYTHRNTDDLNDWTTLLLEPNVQTTEIMIDRELTRYRFRLQSISELGPGIISPVYEISSSRKYVPLEVNLHLVEFEGTWMDDETAAEVEPSTEIQFFCQASGNPIPAVTFFWETMEDDDDGLEPGSTSVLLEQRLRHDYKIDTMIASVTTHTSRNLVCRANNTDGVSESKVAIRINKPGGPPTGIKYTISADNNVTLKWLKPDYANGNLTGYNVYLHNNVTTPVELWRRFELDSEETELFLVRGQLKPSSTYYFVLSANNTYGEGPKSRPIEINTATGGPMDAPHHVDIRVDEHNKVKISWKPPHHPNGQLQNYTIYYTRSRVSDPKGHDGTYKKWQVLGISPLVNTYIIDGRLDGLLPHEQYRLMMSATNDLSEGPPTKVYKFRTRSGVAGKPSNISIVQQFAATVISFDRLYDTRGATPVWIKGWVAVGNSEYMGEKRSVHY